MQIERRDAARSEWKRSEQDICMCMCLNMTETKLECLNKTWKVVVVSFCLSLIVSSLHLHTPKAYPWRREKNEKSKKKAQRRWRENEDFFAFSSLYFTVSLPFGRLHGVTIQYLLLGALFTARLAACRRVVFLLIIQSFISPCWAACSLVYDNRTWRAVDEDETMIEIIFDIFDNLILLIFMFTSALVDDGCREQRRS